MRTLLFLPLLAVVAFALWGCDATTRHKVLTTIFDGVPSLPPAETYCQDYADEKVAVALGERSEEAKGEEEKGAASKRSEHEPYREKLCNDCHDKNKKDGLILPKQQLCLHCHTGFIKGSYVHGPVAVGDCLACHLPHTSSSPSLLKQDPGKICGICHQERRLAAQMHEKVTTNNLKCVDCHDPHFGNFQYFLK